MRQSVCDKLQWWCGSSASWCLVCCNPLRVFIATMRRHHHHHHHSHHRIHGLVGRRYLPPPTTSVFCLTQTCLTYTAHTETLRDTDIIIIIIIIIVIIVDAVERSSSSACQGRRNVRAGDPLRRRWQRRRPENVHDRCCEAADTRPARTTSGAGAPPSTTYHVWSHGTHHIPPGHQRPLWTARQAPYLDHQGRLEQRETKVTAEQTDVPVCYSVVIEIIGYWSHLYSAIRSWLL